MLKLIKRLFCHHKYRFWYRLYNNDIETEVGYQCIKCGKELSLDMSGSTASQVMEQAEPGS